MKTIGKETSKNIALSKKKAEKKKMKFKSLSRDNWNALSLQYANWMGHSLLGSNSTNV